MLNHAQILPSASPFNDASNVEDLPTAMGGEFWAAIYNCR